ncbi:carbohydrate ABC transporter ATP-binding protein, CUT1 family [Salipiger thiooxidans]|uniref:Carbohydrate ABC transporter ATP-binding protein, CUT1 family n=2 Tax=Salipiger TaxID=263377 RepID=A0A1G7BI97_9RHOB|nr:ABC transporter ATP-binding protein [Salipiger thiooxidans]SDE26831.1 carbohydrate ABC transporter ATP-binding protein, CUT1 family [Salipiger thiooxidans]
MASIQLNSVSRIYGQGASAVHAVKGIDLQIEDGEFMIFLGPSGCGKSTTLRMIAGLEPVSQGDLLIDGQRVNDVDPAERDLAIVFQNYALYPHMSVRQNMAFGLKLRGTPGPEIESRIAGVAETLGIRPLLDRKPSQLSGGQRQRVALGRALVREPRAFLLDEPLSNLDAKLRSVMRTELIKLHRKLGTTMIHVTHDQVEAMTMGTRICIMRGGEIVQVGKPQDVYRDPADTFVAGFLATPPMNLIPARIEAAGEGLAVIAPGLSVPVPEAYRAAYAPYTGREVILGIRPEDLFETPEGAAPAAIDCSIETVEALGPETILNVKLGQGGSELAARLPAEGDWEVARQIRLFADSLRMHLFDPETTRKIAR